MDRSYTAAVDGGAILAGGVGLAVGLLLAAAAWRRASRSASGTAQRATAAEGALREYQEADSRRRHVQDVVLESMEEGVALVAPDDAFAFTNAAFARHVGDAPASLAGLLPMDLRRSVERARYIDHVERTEVELGRPARWLRGTAIPVGADGTVLLVVRDVTDARRLDAIRRDFVANASHELKTPAASIQATAETLQHAASDDPAAVPRFSAQLEREAKRLTRIVSDLLDLSRLESGSDLDAPIRLDTVTAEEVRRFRDEAEHRGIDLVLEVTEVPAVVGSPRDTALLVRNLIDNAVRYTPSGGRVEVSVVAEDRHVVLRVADSGAGIPSRDLDRVFERFYRVDRARSRETGGTGLGLAIVKHVVENHGGGVQVESELGRGSVFTVRLPVATG
jgi:two-component system sensor histidine kinase SenX3